VPPLAAMVNASPVSGAPSAAAASHPRGLSRTVVPTLGEINFHHPFNTIAPAIYRVRLGSNCTEGHVVNVVRQQRDSLEDA
jgi:hypothetical protein